MADANVIRTYKPEAVLVGSVRPFVQPYDPAVPPALPANSIPVNGAWPSSWTELGATMNGLEFDFSRKTKKIEIDETPTPLGYTTDSVDFMFGLELAEDTLETWQLSYGGGTISTTAAASGTVGTRQLHISRELQNFSFAFEGKNEKQMFRRVLVPIVLSVANMKTAYNRSTKQRTYKVQFTSLVDIDQVTILEQNAVALP